MSRSRLLAALCAPAIAAGVLLAAPTAAVADGSIATISSVGSGTYDIAFSADGAFAFATSEFDDRVTKINTATRAIVGSTVVGDAPIGLAVRPGSNELWVANSGATTISVLNRATLDTITTINTGINGPFKIVFDSAGTHAYVSHYGGSSLSKINATSRTVIDSQAVSFPQGIALSPNGAWLYAVAPNINGVYKVSTSTLDVATTIAVGTDPFSATVAPNGSELWVTNFGSNSVSIINLATDTVTSTITGLPDPIQIAFGWDGHAWITAIGDDPATVRKYDAVTRELRAAIPLFGDLYGVAARPGSKELYIASRGASEVRIVGTETSRTSGADRYQGSIAVSQAAFPGGAGTVYIASGANYPDALSAGPTAGVDDAPVLLTPGDVLSPALLAEVTRLGASSAVIVGGPASISTTSENQLKSLLGAGNVTRLGGADRYATSRAIVAHGFPGTVTTVYIASGRNFPDALSAGAVGASTGRPVILVDGSASRVDSATLALLASLNPTRVYLAGGPVSVSSGIMTQLQGLYPTTRLSGDTRFETSVAINANAFTSASTAFLASGYGFPDALSGSSWAGLVSAPLYVTQTTCVPNGVLKELDRLGVRTVRILGGPVALSNAVENLVPCG